MCFTINRTATYTLNSYALTVITNTNILHQLIQKVLTFNYFHYTFHK